MYGVQRRGWKAAAVVIALAVAALHGEALRGWWLNDDPQVLLQAERTSTLQLFAEPDAWRMLSTSNYTPLVTMSFEADLRAFGLQPARFYLHHLFSLSILALLFHLLLRDRFGGRAAAAGTLLFLLMPVTFIVARSLMLRHYVEGAAFACASLLVWSRRGDLRGSVIASFLYFAAMLAKEVYAPLPLLFLAVEMERRDASQRGWRIVALRFAAPSVFAAFYLALRTWMLGSAGGYESPDAGAMLRLPIDILRAALVDPQGPAGWWMSVILALFVFVSGRRWGWRRTLPVTLLATLFALLPLLAVAGAVESRYAFVPLLLAAFAASAFASTGRLATGIVVLVAIIVGMKGVAASNDFERWARQQEAEGRYVFGQPSSAPVLLGESPGWYLAGLRDLDQDGSPRFVLSRDALILGIVPTDHVVRATAEGVRPLDPALVSEIEGARRLRDTALPVAATFERSGATLSWMIEPECDCEFRFITLPEFDDHPIPPSGARKVPRPGEEQKVIIRRVERDGRWNATGPITLPR